VGNVEVSKRIGCNGGALIWLQIYSR